MIGIKTLAERLVREIASNPSMADEALLTLADFLIVLREVDYRPREGCLPKPQFEKVFQPFLRELAGSMQREVAAKQAQVSAEVMEFWDRVLGQCR